MADGLAEEPARRTIEYELVDADGNWAGDVQHRYVRVLMDSPETKADVEAVGEAVYVALVEDIERTNADAEYKRVNMLIYDNR